MSSPFQPHTYPIRKVDAARQEPPATPEGSAAAGASEDVAAADTAGSPSGAPEGPAPHETAGSHGTPGASGGGAPSWGVQPGLATPAGGANATPQPGGADVSVPSAQAPEGDLRLFAGLYRRSPWLALATTVFLLSLAGFPFTAGFFGKLYILLGAVAMGNWWLPAVMIVTTAVSYAFYFKIVRQMYMRPGTGASPLPVPPALGVLIAVAAVGTVVLGIFPGLAFDWMQQHLPMLQQFFTPGSPAL